MLKVINSEILGRPATLIHVSGYIRYRELEDIDLDFPIHPVVVLSGKMPSWYQLGLISHILSSSNVEVVGIFRPPANKILIVYSNDNNIPTASWIEPTKKQLEFLRSGEIYGV